MPNDRWSYQVVEVRASFLGATRAAVQERLNQLGLQGWELVSAVQPHQLAPMYLYLKKES